MVIKKTIRRGEDYLSCLAPLQLLLEDGNTYVFRMADEVPPIPEDPRELLSELRKSASRLAFWAWQEQRALGQLRQVERTLAEREGIEYRTVRRLLSEHGDMEMPTEGNIRAMLAFAPALKTEKDLLAEAQRRYGQVRALREALEHRSHSLRRLVNQQSSERE